MTHEELTRRFYAHVWPHRALVLRSARFMTGRAGDADDLAQETLLKAFRAMETFNVRTHAQAWLMTILRHAHIDRLRANSRNVEQINLDDLADDIQDVASPNNATPVHDFASLLDELSDAQIIAGLRRLPQEIGWSLLLVCVQQMTYDEAAAVLEVPEGTAKSRVHRGRRMLRDELLRRGVPAQPADRGDCHDQPV